MATTYSIAELIAQNVLATLQGITEAAGYEVTPAEVVRFATVSRPEPTRDGTIQISEEECERVARLTGKDEYLAKYLLRVFLDQQGDTDAEPDPRVAPIDRRISAYRGSITKALMLDYQRGTHPDTGAALAIDTLIGKAAPFPLNTGRDGFTLSFSVRFFTATDNPYAG